MVTVGDSVTWGQGLERPHKSDLLVATKLGIAEAEIKVTAHSGAIIGVNREAGTVAPTGEVPDSYPTILEQVRDFNDPPDTVELVLINGGINDVNVRTILNPLTSFDDLGDRTRLHCYEDMKTLLRAVAAKFTNPATRIAVLGYYAILSLDSLSKADHIMALLQLHGISFPLHLDLGPIFRKIVSLCMQFRTDSTQYIKLAVGQMNAELGTKRFVFVPCPFTDKNAVFASDPRLFGVSLQGIPPRPVPQDEVATGRAVSCDIFHHDPLDVLAREQCHFASAGHPNLPGARDFANVIVVALS